MNPQNHGRHSAIPDSSMVPSMVHAPSYMNHADSSSAYMGHSALNLTPAHRSQNNSNIIPSSSYISSSSDARGYGLNNAHMTQSNSNFTPHVTQNYNPVNVTHSNANYPSGVGSHPTYQGMQRAPVVGLTSSSYMPVPGPRRTPAMDFTHEGMYERLLASFVTKMPAVGATLPSVVEPTPSGIPTSVGLIAPNLVREVVDISCPPLAIPAALPGGRAPGPARIYKCYQCQFRCDSKSTLVSHENIHLWLAGCQQGNCSCMLGGCPRQCSMPGDNLC